MRANAKLHAQRQAKEAVWNLLVNYLNGGEAWELVSACANLYRLDPMGRPSELKEVAAHAAHYGVSVEQALSSLADGYRARFQNLAKWLAAPLERRTLAVEGVAFLDESGDAGSLQPFDYWRFEGMGEADGAPLYLGETDFRTIAAPVCRFIRDRVRLYQEGESTLAEAFPVRLCKRDGCPTFFLSERKGGQYCSDRCRALHHQQQKPSEEKAAYIWLYRLESLGGGRLRRKLAEAAARKRLHRIGKQFPNLAGRAEALLRAAK
jgi:hypothetical protein